MKYINEYDIHTDYIELTESINNNELLSYINKLNESNNLDEIISIEEKILNMENIDEGVFKRIRKFISKKKKKVKKWFKNFFNGDIVNKITLTGGDAPQQSEQPEEVVFEQHILLEYILPFAKGDIVYRVFDGRDASNYDYPFDDVFRSHLMGPELLEKIKEVKGKMVVYKMEEMKNPHIEYFAEIYARTPEDWEVDEELYGHGPIEELLPRVRVYVVDADKSTLDKLLKDYHKKLLSLHKDYDERLDPSDTDFNKKSISIVGDTILIDKKIHQKWDVM